MGLLNKTIEILNEAAFGDIRSTLQDELFMFKIRPIGLLQKSYGYMLNHIHRNIGNNDYVYDGYSTPIGQVSNPFYNTISKTPWFYLDNNKNSTSNYLDYIRNVYGATISVMNINENDFFKISDDASKVGSVDGKIAIEALENSSELIPNPNYTGIDTKLGIDGGYYNQETLNNSIVTNDKRASYKFGITSGVKERLGLTKENVTKNHTYSTEMDEESGRYVANVFSSLYESDGPIFNSNYGHPYDIGAYTGYYNKLTEKSKEYYKFNVYNEKRLYYPTILNGESASIKGRTYFGKVGLTIGHENLSKLNKPFFAVSIDELQIRYFFETYDEQSNIADTNGGVYVYTEKEFGSTPDISETSFNGGVRFGKYFSYGDGLKYNDLLRQTNNSFKEGTYKTIIARFHTDKNEANSTDTTQTAISKKYGLSHGRNLLKSPDSRDEKVNGYDNPYCRVWTFHHQYHRLKDAIRPLDADAEKLYSKYRFSAFTADHSDYGFDNGRVRLEKFGALNKNNGLVNITPIDNSDASKKVDVRNCMFSIENLAWKDVFNTDASSRETFQKGGLSPEQKGPFGGRIMWFPPYGLSFNEDVTVNWNETNFIGRGEGIYTYANTTRTGTLNFKLLVDHPSIIDYWENRGKTSAGDDSVDDDNSIEQNILRFFAGCDILSAENVPSGDPDLVVSDGISPSPSTQILKFYVFFPNNYSGVDDGFDNALKYLTNGLGAGKCKRYIKKSNGTCVQKKEITDYQAAYALADNGYGGYEMRPNKPISIGITSKTENGKICDVKIGQGTGINCNDGKLELFAQEGPGGIKWYYRVDDAYLDHVLPPNSYFDESSSCLNSFAGLTKVIEECGVIDADNIFSFADVYAALGDSDVKSVLSGLYDESNVSKFLNRIGSGGKNIYSIECIGMASKDGYENSNETLKQNRANTISNWLKSKLTAFEGSPSPSGSSQEGGNRISGHESEIGNKIWRSVEVRICLKKSDSNDINNVASERNIRINGTENQVTNLTGDLSILSKRKNALNFHEGIGRTVNSLYDLGKSTYNLFDFNNDNNDSTEILSNRPRSDESTINEFINGSEVEITGETVQVDSIGVNNSVRYDSESRFFSLLEKEEPFLHHKIKDKIKYFDPAFHSISPEGFNARLTFLQQCTRQGPTIGNSDNSTGKTANNLSFGRPPVCILRLGDFYYTKIIIEGISFSFDPLVWDLNTEGIGVMPMICDINMRFKFIGGSSLAGHITRLQNALSFNYYANTEVFDNRSELADYDENGNIIKFSPNPTSM